MYTVSQLLQTKKGDVWTIAPESTVYEALVLMAQKNIGALVVVSGDKVVGIFSERDYARKVVLMGKSSKSVTISELMTKGVLYVSPSDTIENCMAIMSDKHFRHLPVLEEGRLVGLISIGDVVKAIIRDREFVIRELERYITGGHTSD